VRLLWHWSRNTVSYDSVRSMRTAYLYAFFATMCTLIALMLIYSTYKSSVGNTPFKVINFVVDDITQR
jgi:hypothetical protein